MVSLNAIGFGAYRNQNYSFQDILGDSQFFLRLKIGYLKF